MTAEQMLPPYWINMGALTITTLAGMIRNRTGPTRARQFLHKEQ